MVDSQLYRIFQGHLDAFMSVDHLKVAAERDPEPERLRQLERSQAANAGGVPDAELCVCLAWVDVHALTERLLRRAGCVNGEEDWYVRRSGGPHLWRVAVCMPELRLAAAFVGHLRLAGVNLNWLEYGIRNCA